MNRYEMLHLEDSVESLQVSTCKPQVCGDNHVLGGSG